MKKRFVIALPFLLFLTPVLPRESVEFLPGMDLPGDLQGKSGSESGEVQSLSTVPEIKQLQFEKKSELLLKGSATQEKQGIRSCTGNLPDTEILRNLTLISRFYQNGCYTDGKYNASDFRVEEGEAILSDGSRYEAYRIHPPAHGPQKFLASHHIPAILFPEKKDYILYKMDGDGLKVVEKIPSGSFQPGQFRMVDSLDASRITSPLTILVVPGNEGIHLDSRYGENMRGAAIEDNGAGRYVRLQVDVTGTPFDTLEDYTAGPADHANAYGTNRRFFYGKLSEKERGIVWQDQKNGSLHLTILDSGYHFRRDLLLPGEKNFFLLGVAYEPSGNFVILSVELDKAGPTMGRGVVVTRYDASGKRLKSRRLDNSQNGLNVHFIAETWTKARYVTSMKSNGVDIGVVLSRIMLQTPDGLNHQGAIAFVLDGTDLDIKKNLGQTSGHSFGNVLTVEPNGKFLALDLGDNYPRGLHLHRFDANRKDSRVVYTFKTAHGTGPMSPAKKVYPVYREITTPGKRYFQWSNDNYTYTEPGALIPTDSGILVLFASEFPSLDNTRTGEALNVSRNLAFVRVVSDFEKAPDTGEWISPDLLLSRGISEEGEFYDFNGKLHKQRNVGVVKLTDYRDPQINVSRVKGAPLPDGRILILWEIWSGKDYRETRGLILRPDGSVDTPSFPISSRLRLNRQDDLIPLSGGILSLAGRKEGKLILNFLITD